MRYRVAGLEDEDIQELLRAANKSNLLMINGMELAALAAEGSTVLDLTGCGISLLIVGMCIHEVVNIGCMLQDSDWS